MKRPVVYEGFFIGPPVYVARDEEDAKRWIGKKVAELLAVVGRTATWQNSLTVRVSGLQFHRQYSIVLCDTFDDTDDPEDRTGWEITSIPSTQLVVDESVWNTYKEQFGHRLSEELKEWLSHWELDMWVVPQCDRGKVRLDHYAGWFSAHHKRETKK